MAFVLLLLTSIVVSMLQWGGNAQPSPGYYPSHRFKPLPGFYHGYSNLWGAQHQTVSGDQSSVTLWLDRSSGSGFKSNRPYRSGYFAASIKLQAGYTAGVITAFYVSELARSRARQCQNVVCNCLIDFSPSSSSSSSSSSHLQLSNDQAHPGSHDEVDIEFMGNTPGKPYRLQTNIYIRGTGDRRYVGREMKFHLWFDPTADFHNYAILWNPNEIIFFVDDIPIRRYPRKSADIFPMRPMWMYGTIWDASAWATDRGKYRVDYRYQPFVARFTKFIIRGCSAFAPPYCRQAQSSPMGSGLSPQQYAAMQWVQNNYMVYNYCTDPGRDHSRTPECY